MASIQYHLDGPELSFLPEFPSTPTARDVDRVKAESHRHPQRPCLVSHSRSA